jgi:IstB-like ATP binding protein
MAATKTASRDVTAELAFLTRALKAPTMRESVPRLAERARAESWTHEEFLAACLQREVAAREAHGGEDCIRAARFPARKSLEEFDFDHARGLRRDLIAHLGTLDFAVARDNVILPGAGKTHLAIGLAIRACQAGHRVLFATAAEWVARARRGPPRRAAAGRTGPAGPLPAAGHRRGRLHPLRGRGRQPVLPARPARYERASLIVTSNKSCGRSRRTMTTGRWSVSAFRQLGRFRFPLTT